MKRFLMTMALTSVLSVSVLAGEMPTCGAPAPAAGEMPGVGASAPAPSATQSSAAVTVLLTILSLVVR